MVMFENEAGAPALGLLEAGDAEPLRRFFYRLSPETVYRRFLSPIARPEQAHPERLLDLDHHDREAILAAVEGEIVGIARYFRVEGSDSAEIAVVVADEYQHHGLGTRLLARLAEAARRNGIREFAVTVQADNRASIGLVRHFDPEVRFHLAGAVYEATLPLTQEELR